MTLFAHRFLTVEDYTKVSTIGCFDERRGLRVDVDGNPVVGGSARAAPTTTRGDIDPPAVLSQTVTKADVDPDRAAHRSLACAAPSEGLGPIKTSADLDENRRGWH
jgi:hypothetical protein